MKFYYSTFILFLFLLTIYSDEAQKGPYRFITAKTGLNLREKPDTESESLGNIPDGKIVKIIRILDESVNIKGSLSKWALVQYSWKEGYVVSEFLDDEKDLLEESKPLKKADILGTWKGEWKWEKNYTKIIFQNKTFKAFLFDGGDDAGYTGHEVNGKWSLKPEKNPTEICLQSKKEDVCFFLYNKKLVVNMNRTVEGKQIYFEENFGFEILSGLQKEK